MRKIVRIVAFCLLFSGVNSPIFASQTHEKNDGMGIVRGRIIDTEKQILPGASIYIENLQSGTISDVNGFYLIPNLKPGIYKVKVTYVGYATKEMTIKVSSGKTNEMDIVLNEGVELGEVVVGGAFTGQRGAINSQKSKQGVVNVVSADQVGKFPDSNIGDALKRINGINVQYDQGEARFGQVRGTSADFSSVTLNGNRIPSAEEKTRNVQLDLIPSDMVQTIEVNKVVTADMDGDAIGGSVNLVTKNSPLKRTFAATAGSGYNWISKKAQLNMGLTYGDLFFNDKLGMILSASYQNSPSGSDNTEFEWKQDKDGNAYIYDYQIRQYYVTRERQNYTASFDYKFNANNKVYFKGMFTNRNDWENRYRTTLKKMDTDGAATVRVQTKGGSSDNRNARLERQRTMDFSLGGEHQWGILSADWNASYAKATESRPNERYIDFELKKQKFDVDLTDERKPYASPKTGSTMTLDDSFSLKELTEQFKDVKEEDKKFRLNFKLPLVKGYYKNSLKFGAKYVDKTKDRNSDFYNYTPIDKKEFMTNSLANSKEENRKGFMAGDKYKTGEYASNKYLGSLDLNDETKFKKEQNKKEMSGDFNATEKISSGYFMFNQNIGKKININAGLRAERTDIKYKGTSYDSSSDELVYTPYEKNNYTDLLPSLLLKYDVNDDLQIRASYTKTLSRPKYSSLAPNTIVKDEKITLGNPELNATYSNNIDISVDYYFKSVGLVTAGLFYKDITGFIVNQTTLDYTYNGVQYDKAYIPKNAGDAKIFGMEFAYQRDFGFIAPALKAIGFYGTYTYTHSKVSNFNFEGRENESGLKLPGSPEHTANASLYYEKKGFNLRCSYNFASDFIDEMGENAFADRYYDKVGYLDANASYTFGQKTKITVYAEANNLLNQPLRYYQGTKDRTMQTEYYGVKVNAGIKLNF